MNFIRDPEEQRFREECQAFLRDALTPDLIRYAEQNYHAKRSVIQTWTRAMNAKGWSVVKWPVEYGGMDWSPMKKFIFECEMRAGNAPIGDRLGVELIGPVIYTFGSDEQKSRYLPAIRNADQIWCQGFSEPGAGSDLASLRTSAVREGDDYIVTGQKMWTTQAHMADMMLALVRTGDKNGKPQSSISMLLIDLKSPGVSVRPVRTIDEGISVNEVFLDSVRVPVSNLVGVEGAGWSQAKFLLTNERTVSAEVPHIKHDIAQIKKIVAAQQNGAMPMPANEPANERFASKLAQLEIDVRALEFSVLRVLCSDKDSSENSAVASVLKTRGSELWQRAADLAAEALSVYSVAAVPDEEDSAYIWETDLTAPVPEYAIGVSANAMFRRSVSIYGGTNEVQRSIIAKSVLGL